MLYWAFRVASALAGVAPVRVSYALGRTAGVLAYYVWFGGRRRCVRNMLHVSGGDLPRARTLARRSFGNYGVYLIDFLRFTSLSPDQIRRRVVFDDWDQLSSHRRGNGIVFITLHYGNWDLGAAALALNGFPISVIADSFADERLNDLVLGARQHLGMDIVPAERMGPRILRALRRNDVVAVLIDIPAGTGEGPGGTAVQFFGDTVVVPDGPARLALRAGASVVAATLPRRGPWNEQVHGQVAHIPFTPSGDDDRDAHELTQATMLALEEMVARAPEQWYIFRHLWQRDRRAARDTGPVSS